MCKHGDYVEIVVQGKKIRVDRCLEHYIKALNSNGIITTDSCCGHGERIGYIRTYSEEEYREIAIFPKGEISLKMFAADFQEVGEHFDAIRQGLKNEKEKIAK